MKTLTADFDPTALSPYDEILAGQLHDADQQCANIRGVGSYLCRVCITNTVRIIWNNSSKVSNINIHAIDVQCIHIKRISQGSKIFPKIKMQRVL